jgi:hypothetical protein
MEDNEISIGPSSTPEVSLENFVQNSDLARRVARESLQRYKNRILSIVDATVGDFVTSSDLIHAGNYIYDLLHGANAALEARGQRVGVLHLRRDDQTADLVEIKVNETLIRTLFLAGFEDQPISQEELDSIQDFRDELLTPEKTPVTVII